jgi:hypothetical protein
VAKTNEKVLAAVEAALKKNPDASNAELFVLAKGVSRSIGKLSKRQFHAQYPLQVKRLKKLAAKPAKAATKAAKPAAKKAAKKKAAKAAPKKAAAKKAAPKKAAAKKAPRKSAKKVIRTAITRAAKRATGPRRPRATAGASGREEVRATLLSFASDLAAAEARADVVRVVASVDRYVDRVMKATGSK